MMKGFIRGTIVFVLGLLVAVGLLVASYALIPTSKMQERLFIDWQALNDTWDVQPLAASPNGTIDHQTDYHMLALASFDDYDNPLVAAMQNPYAYDKNDEFQIGHLRATLHLADEADVAQYPRYWHGYLVPLKLQLFLMGYHSILVYNGGALLALVVVVSLLLYKRGKGVLIPPLLLVTVLCGPLNIALTMEYYACAYVILLALVSVLALGERVDPFAGTFFLLVGMVTNYLDFLVYPIATLGIPLAVYALLPHDAKHRLTVRRTLMICACWAFGYAGMWVAKWAIASIVLGQNVFADAIEQMSVRTSSTFGHVLEESAPHFSYIDVLKKTWGDLVGTYPAIACVGLTVIWELVMTIRHRDRVRKNAANLKAAAFPCFMCTVMPFIWAAALQNHTYMHHYFTFRIFAPTIAAPLCLWAALFAKPSSLQRDEQEVVVGKHVKTLQEQPA